VASHATRLQNMT